MQPYDFLMIAVLVGLTLYGYSKGMAWQLAYLTSLFASYFVAVRFADQFAPMFGQSAPLNKFVAMLVIYIATSFIIWMLFRVVRGAIDKVKMEGFDHQMGALIGFARGFLWCVGITFFAVTLLPENMKMQVVQTKSGRTLAKLLDQAHAVVPPELHDVVGPVLSRLEQGINGNAPPAGQAWPVQGNLPFPSQPTGGQPFQPQAYQQPTANTWPVAGQTGGWPNPNPGGASAWPQAAPQQSGGWPQAAPSGGPPTQQVGWPNPNP